MIANVKLRSMIILLVMFFAVWFLYPTIRLVYMYKIKRIEYDALSSEQLKKLKKGTLSLGLDLQGGVDLVYSIDSEKMIENILWKEARTVKEQLEKDGNLEISVNVKSAEREIHISFPDVDAAKIDQMTAVAQSMTGSRGFKKIPGDDTSRKLVLKFEETETSVSDAMDKAVEIIRNRVDMFAVSEPTISKVGLNQLNIQLPGVSNVREAVDIIGTTAQLEFRLVRQENGFVRDAADIMSLPKPAEDEEIIYGVRDESGKIPVYILKKIALLTGEYLTNATIIFDHVTSNPLVALSFDKEGSRKFYDITSKYTKWQLAIVLDNKVQSAPVIEEPIPNGNAVIRGQFTDEEAKKLSIVLRAGALPAPLRKDSEVTVGPTLGADSIRKGVSSLGFGFLMVVLYMMVYYRLSGLMANMALFLNGILVLAVLALLRGTLTLPGLAGLVLTVGMAVDANVIIFERIKEELKEGKTPRASIEAGFEKAFSAILDSNLTTILTAVILYIFGTGPIKGFAVTLGLGVASSMFTALFVVRTIMMWVSSGQKKVISI